MKQIIKYIGLLAILPLVMIALAPDLIADAFALQKAEGSDGYSPPKSYGSATADIVCGDRLCSTPDGEQDPVNVSQPR